MKIHFNHSVSILIPLHNKALTITPTLNKLKEDLTHIDFEIIVIENSSTDNSFEVCQRWCQENKDVDIKLITSKKGLGVALKAGIDLAKNDYLWTVPGDMQLGTSDLESFIKYFDFNIKFYIGSRLHPESDVERQSNRILISSIFNLLKKIIINSNIKDSMGSFIAEKKLIKKLYNLPKTKKFFYITELISYYEFFGFKVLEIPVSTFKEIDLSSGNKSSVNFILDPIEIFFNLLMLRFRLIVSKVKKRKLSQMLKIY